MSEANFVTCRCQYCDKDIEFDANELEITGSASGKVTGQTTPCPHCGMETLLFIPNAPAQKTSDKKEKTAQLIKETMQSGGMEDSLDDVGGIILFLGVLGGGISVVAGILAFNNNETPIGVDLLCVGIAAIFVSAINRILFRTGAEVIRLLKKLNGLKYSGKITQPDTHTNYKCSACGGPVHSDSVRCDFCSSKFEK